MSSNEQREALKIISELLEDPYNQICADCQCQPSKWASTTLGVFICIDCSGVHRSLGTHISFVRSCTLDTWMLEQARLMKAIGNRLGNSYWEAKLPKDFQRPGNSNRSLMQAFIKNKYQIKKWADAGPPPHIVYKHLLMKQLSISNQIGDGTQRKSKSSRHHHHSSRRSSSRHSEKAQNSNTTAETPKPTTPITPVTQPQDDFSIPLDDFFAEQPRRTIPKPYIPHKKVVYEKPKEEPDYENMNSDEIDKFFQNQNDNSNGDNVNYADQDNTENENGRNRSNSLEQAMMQRIQTILDEEKPKKSLNRNRGQIEYDDNYENDEEEEDDIFGDSAVAVKIPFGQHPSKSDPQLSNIAQSYNAFDNDTPPNTASLQTFFEKNANANKTQLDTNTTDLNSIITPNSNSLTSHSNNIGSNLTSNITSYSNLNISPNTNREPLQDEIDNNEDNQHRQQAIKTKKQRSVVLSKTSRMDKEKESSNQESEAIQIEKEEDQFTSQPPTAQPINNDENASIETDNKSTSFLPSLDNINLDIGPELTDLGGAANDDGGFWDDDANNNNDEDEGFFELPPSKKFNNIQLEGKALIQQPQQIQVIPQQPETVDTETENDIKKIIDSNFSVGISNAYETFDEPKKEENINNTDLPQIDKEEAHDALFDYNPFATESQGNLSDMSLASLLDKEKGKQEINKETELTGQYESFPQPEIDLNELAAEIGVIEEEEENNENKSQLNEQEEDKKEDPQSLINQEEQKEQQINESNFTQQDQEQLIDIQEDKESPASAEQQEDIELPAAITQTEQEHNETQTADMIHEEEEKETPLANQHQDQEEEEKEMPPTNQQQEQEQEEQLQEQSLISQEAPKADMQSNNNNININNETQQQTPAPAYSCRPSKLSIAMVSAMDLKPPGFTEEDEIIDDFFAEAEASITAPKPSQSQQQPSHARRSHKHRLQAAPDDYEDDNENDNNNDAFGIDTSKSRRKKESNQTPPDVAVSRTQKSAFAPPPARKPGAHIPARLQKKMEPPPSEKETRKKKHHHSKK
ncbi:GTPase activator activity protein [Tritrichomonas musculus]|uniref:GTPase activator activity protein n=1 Tax=Tritrichomonas musculus TaxID=1915356 RepID=A0ABR2KBY3_9EUKA